MNARIKQKEQIKMTTESILLDRLADFDGDIT